MATRLKVEDLKVGKRYNVFYLPDPFRDSYREMHGLKTGAVEWTGTFTKIEDGQAVIEKDEKDERGRPVKGYFGNDSYRFEEVAAPSAPAFKKYPAGNAINAARALKQAAAAGTGGRRRTRRRRTIRMRKHRKTLRERGLK